MKKRILALALALALVVGIVPAQAAGSPFWDVPETHWAYQDVMAAYQDGVMKGVGGGKFNPNGYLTVAEWCCILARGFFPYEIESKQYVNWYNREMEVLESHYVYSKRSDDEIKNVSGYASRSFMADTIYNLIRSRVEELSEMTLMSYREGIPDLMSTVEDSRWNAVASCYAWGILKGVGGNNFDGTGYVQRGAAAAVYNRTKATVANGGKVLAPVPDPIPGVSHVVGTMTTVPLPDPSKEMIATHAPIVDYWSQQSEEIKRIADKDHFNAAAQTVRDSHMILTQGAFATRGNKNRNIYYNYSVVADAETEVIDNVGRAMFNLSGHNGQYGGYGGVSDGYMFYLIRPYADAIHTAVAPILAQYTPGMSDSEKARIAARAVADRLEYSTTETGGSWTGGNKGTCESYATMLQQLLAISDIPCIHTAGTVGSGNGHAWLQVYLDGEWKIMDAVCTDFGYEEIFSYAEHERLYNYNHGLNNLDCDKVSRALIECAYFD